MLRIARFGGAALLGASLLLSGCATGYLLDNTVQSFSSLPALPAPATFRFERLPSQQADPAQATLEAMAAPALATAGFRLDDGSPRFSVQLTARMQRMLSPYADPWDWGGWGWGYGSGWGIGFGRPFGRMESPWFHREVNVVVRELPSARVVFESQATNQGPWLDNRSVLPAMFEAALQGFPNPPAGPRRVDIQVGARKSP
jgi:hypothetical protein